MMNRRSFIANGFAVAPALQEFGVSGTGSAEFYVAPEGLDGNPGNKSKPFATLERARDEVRTLIGNGLKANVTVWVHGGTYTLQETLMFGLEDSGTDQYSITYQAVPGEGPILSSGVKVEGWKELDTHGQRAACPCPWQGLGGGCA